MIGSVEGSAGRVGTAVVVDRDLLHFAEIDILPDRVGAIIRVDDFYVPVAGLRRTMEFYVDGVAVGQRAGAEHVFFPVIGFAGRDINLFDLVPGFVGQVKILSSFGVG